jgi:hypothetical protein
MLGMADMGRLGIFHVAKALCGGSRADLVACLPTVAFDRLSADRSDAEPQPTCLLRSPTLGARQAAVESQKARPNQADSVCCSTRYE